MWVEVFFSSFLFMVRIACHNRCQPTKWNPSRGHNFRVSIALLVGCCVVLNSCRVCSSNDSIIFYYYYLFLFLVTGCRHVTLYTFHALWCVCVCVCCIWYACVFHPLKSFSFAAGHTAARHTTLRMAMKKNQKLSIQTIELDTWPIGWWVTF